MSTQRTVHKILSVTEGEALRLLEAFLVTEQRSFSRVSLKIDHPSKELVVAAKDRLSKAAVRFLFAGANRDITVLRDGQRIEGRLWDEALNQGFVLRFTEHSYQFWLGACKQLALLNDINATKPKKTVRGVFAEDSTVEPGTGDWIFFHLVHSNLGKFGLTLELQNTITKRLRQSSPLLGLFLLERDALESDILKSMKLLVQPSAIRILECMEERLIAAWEAEISRLYAVSGTAEQLAARWTIVTRVLRSYLDALNDAGRLDLSLSVLRTMLSLMKKTFSQGATAIRSRVAAQAGVKNLQQRDLVVNAIAACLSLATWVYQQRDFLAAQRYGDDRYGEAQLFVRRVDVFSSSRAEVDTLVRALSGTIG
jgi:hypothetical protein